MSRGRLRVLGGGGHAKVIIATARAAGWTVAEVFDDDESKWGQTVLGVPVLGPLEAATENGESPAVLAVGDNESRALLVERYSLDWTTLVHPAAVVDPASRISPGTVIFAGVVVQPDCEVGAHVILNTASTIDHDCRLGDFVHIAPGSHLGGEVLVGEGALLGIGCAILPGVSIGARATVGAGGVVVSDVAEAQVVAGAPARRLHANTRRVDDNARVK